MIHYLKLFDVVLTFMYNFNVITITLIIIIILVVYLLVVIIVRMISTLDWSAVIISGGTDFIIGYELYVSFSCCGSVLVIYGFTVVVIIGDHCQPRYSSKFFKIFF